MKYKKGDIYGLFVHSLELHYGPYPALTDNRDGTFSGDALEVKKFLFSTYPPDRAELEMLMQAIKTAFPKTSEPPTADQIRTISIQSGLLKN